MPKICMLTTVHQALDSRIFSKEARSLAASGFDTVIIGAHPRSETVDGVRIVPLPAWQRRTDRLKGMAAAARLALAERADVYHVHDPELLPVGWWLKQKTQARVIYDCHEFLAEDVLTKRWIPAAARPLVSKAVSVLEGGFARRIDGVVGAVADMVPRFRSLGARAVAIHNYAPLDLFEAEPAAPNYDAPRIVYLGLLEEQRGLHTLLRTMAILEHSEPRLRCDVIGRVNRLDEYRRAGGRVPENVRFLGVLPYGAALAKLQGAIAGWLPFHRTVAMERAMPIKLIEYMGAGLPVVASDYGLMGEMIRGAACGLLVPPDNPDAHAQAFLRLVREPQFQDQLRRRARAAFLARYNWEGEAARLVGFYHDLLGHTGEESLPCAESPGLLL